jgi:hypothetical protein
MGDKYYEFEVELTGLRPRIWRRFYLTSGATFEALHGAIQAAFGWQGYHLYEFRVAGRRGEALCGHKMMVEEGLLAMLAERPRLFEERLDKHITTAAGLTLIAPHTAARRCWAQLGLLDHAWV